MRSPFPPRRGSLARSALIKMGARVAVIIALMTLASYFHILRAMRAQALTQLEGHVSERVQREQALFLQAEDNHRILQEAVAKRIRAWQQQDPGPRFDSLFARFPDGTVRSRPQGFDGTQVPGVYIPQGVPLDDDLRRRLLAAHEVTTQYGPAFHVRFTDTFILLPEGAISIYWPEGATCELKDVHAQLVETARRAGMAEVATNINLISNAKYALDSVPTPQERRIRLQLGPPSEDRVRITVRDNGVGIPPELITRIFQYGFTTREEGHGFGLHSAALAAQELGGTLQAHSEGLGQGATFTLELLLHPTEGKERLA
jgi:hypothetical protein